MRLRERIWEDSRSHVHAMFFRHKFAWYSTDQADVGAAFFENFRICRRSITNLSSAAERSQTVSVATSNSLSIDRGEDRTLFDEKTTGNS